MASFSGRRSTCSEPKFQVCVIGNGLKENEKFIKAIKMFNLSFVFSENGQEFMMSGAEFNTIFILEEFEGDVFTTLHKAGQRILGPIVVMQCAEKGTGLPNFIRPLYTSSMKGLLISFTGFQSKEELSTMVALIHHMGGSIRKVFNVSKITHLIASPIAASGQKYKHAANMGIPIMTSEWVFQTWERRHDPSIMADGHEMMQYKLKPFVGCKMAFYGYSASEEDHMIEVSLQNGGEIVKAVDPTCTHIIVEDGSSIDYAVYPKKVKIVKNEWFWACIQMEAKADESIYGFENQPNVVVSATIQPVKGNKRKRNESIAHQLAVGSFTENEISFLNQERSDAAKLSNSCSRSAAYDVTYSPGDLSVDVSYDDKDYDLSLLKSPPLDVPTLSPRQHVCLELFQTESNYVGILNTIMTVFKEPLEQPDQIGGPLLAPAEIKIIFGNLPPIFEIHQKIRGELANIIYCWSDDQSIGRLFNVHIGEFKKAYPPFVNFFEKTKEVLTNCDSTKPRFHAFLKRCQSKPECCRQTLQELLIRPVQRLPSIILLLGDILKHTENGHVDHAELENAIKELKEVMNHINEDKRKTESQVAMFDIMNDIENCPVTLLASTRQFILKADMVELTDLLSKKAGTIITMFLFSDIIEFCKKRSKATNTTKSPSVISLHAGPTKSLSKSYKHIQVLSLQSVKRVVKVDDSGEIKNCFALATLISKELNVMDDKMYAFILLDDVDRESFLKTLTDQIASCTFKSGSDNIQTTLPYDCLGLQSSNDNSGNVISKVMYKARDKLGRALSMRKTPTKRGLCRAVSTIMTPLRNIGTPSGSISTLRLSSVTNLSEYESNSNCLACSPPVGAKKMKVQSLGVSASKEL